jgi:hypothetical protein
LSFSRDEVNRNHENDKRVQEGENVKYYEMKTQRNRNYKKYIFSFTKELLGIKDK